MDAKSFVSSLLKDSGLEFVDGAFALDEETGSYDLQFYVNIKESGISKVLDAIKDNSKQQFVYRTRFDKTRYYLCHLSDYRKGSGAQVSFLLFLSFFSERMRDMIEGIKEVRMRR